MVWRAESDCTLYGSVLGRRVVSGDRAVQHRVLPVPLPLLLPLVEEAADADENDHDNYTDNDDDEADTHLRRNVYIIQPFLSAFASSYRLNSSVFPQCELK